MSFLGRHFYFSCIWLTPLFALAINAQAQTITLAAPNATLIELTIANGCRMNDSTATSGISLGTINLGKVFALNTDIDAQSNGTSNGIRVRCTPGVTAIIKINAGLYGTGTTRYMRRLPSTTNLSYQIYRNAARTQIWDNVTGVSHTFTSDANVHFPIYVRVPAQATPAAGIYSDTLTVTLEY